MLPTKLTTWIEAELHERIQSVQSVAGGCIANNLRVTSNRRDYFVKWGHGFVAAGLAAEAKGLEELSAARSGMRIPEVIGTARLSDGNGLLILEWINTAPISDETWTRFGTCLAALHCRTDVEFGYESDNFIGRTPQANTRSPHWVSFFRDQRILKQVELAKRSGHWKHGWDGPLERLCLKLGDFLPEKPDSSLVHGDLWLGNFLSDGKGTPVLIDPAVYFGHSEVDLAMTKLFGSPPRSFYQSYHASRPIEYGSEERRSIYNLYHLINHLNLFGAAYIHSVEEALGRF